MSQKTCKACARPLERKRFNGRLEDRGIFQRRVYCDRACMARGMRKSPSDLTRSGLLVRARRHLKSACENCGTEQRLSIHHIDRDWRNNSPENLMTLCASCHTSHHHATGDIVSRSQPRSCPACGEQFLPKDRRVETCSRSCGWIQRKKRSKAS